MYVECRASDRSDQSSLPIHTPQQQINIIYTLIHYSKAWSGKNYIIQFIYPQMLIPSKRAKSKYSKCILSLQNCTHMHIISVNALI